MMNPLHETAVNYIQQNHSYTSPQVGIILGSGLGNVVNALHNTTAISYTAIPHFPIPTIAGHAGTLHLGHLGTTPVACLQGRVHRYEGANRYAMQKIMIHTLKALGCNTLIITNSAGALTSDFNPGELALIADHINFSFDNPLVAETENRFVDLVNAYDATLRARCLKLAQHHQIPLKEGIYLGVLGPSFETPAEIRAFRTLGASLVGMSTIPEVIIARHSNLKVMAISAITNLAAGMSAEPLSHANTLHYGEIATQQLTRLLTVFLENTHVE